MFRYHDHAVLDEEFDCGGFDDVLALAAEGRSIVPDAPYGEYSADTAQHASYSVWAEREGRKAKELRERAQQRERERIERARREALERDGQEYSEWRQRARDLYFRAEKDRIRREMVDCVITLPIYDKDEWERVIAAHNAWLASWGNNG